jgi:hypothetical protein
MQSTAFCGAMENEVSTTNKKRLEAVLRGEAV